jgi:DNA invertase Pin-like site-specific DNA recombinase
MFKMLSLFSDHERAMIRERVIAGLNRVRGKKRLGRPPMAENKVEAIKCCLNEGKGIRQTARETGASTTSVMRVARSLAAESAHAKAA